jgi:hypothetical protein
MKKIFFLAFLLAFESALAKGPTDYQNFPNQKNPQNLPSIKTVAEQKSAFGELFFKPSLSLEYNAPRFSQSGQNSSFKNSGTIFHQLGDLSNIAIGGNFRVHKYLGFNANWVQSELLNSRLQGEDVLTHRAKLKFDQYNFSALFYIPAVENLFEIFAEGGVSDLRGRMVYSTASGDFSQKTHETVGFYGAGFQIVVNEKDSIRFSWQRYTGRVGPTDSQYSTTRIGYLRAF